MILNSPYISGSLTVTGNIIASGSITISGSIASASYASNADLLDGLDSTAFATTGAYSATSASLYSTSASLSTASGSFNTRVTALEATGSALSSSLLTVSGSGYATSASLSTDSGSFNSRVATIESKYATTGSNNFRAPQYISDTTVPTGFSNTTGSIYTDGGIQVTKDSYFSSSMFIKGNLTIYGTQSVAYITSSQLNIATNLITVNTATPSVRFGGLAVYDSGSTGTGATGSLLWDSQNNGWVYQRESGSTYAGGMLISGPRRALGSNLGDEQGLTACMIPVAQGGDHITSSLIYHDSSVTCIQTAVIGTSTACFAGVVCSNGNVLIGGSGTANYLPKFTAGTTIGNSAIQDDGTTVTITSLTKNVGEFRIYPSSGTAVLRFGSGSTEKGKLSVDTSTNMIFETGGYERMRLDASGNLGLGVSPSAWARGKALEIGTIGNSIWGDVNNEITTITSNAYLNTSDLTTGWAYGITAASARYDLIAGVHKWFTAPSGTAGNPITFTQAMTLTASGRLLINTPTESTYQLDVNGTGRYTGIVTFGSTGGSGLRVYGGSGTNQWDVYLNSTNLRFSDNTGTGSVVFDRPISGTSATFSSSVQAVGTMFLQRASGGASTTIQFKNEIGNNRAKILFGGSVEELGFYAGDGSVANLTIAQTGAATFSSSVTATSELCITSGDGAGKMLKFTGGTTKYNWMIAAQQNVNNALEITPSSAAGGSTFSTPAVTVLSSGNVGIGGYTAYSMTSPYLMLKKGSCFSEIILSVCGTTQLGAFPGNAITSEGNLMFGSDGGYTSFITYVNGYTSYCEAMRITSAGNVGIGTTSPVTANLVGSMTIVKCYNGDTPTSTTAQTYYINQSNLYLFGRNAGLTMVGNANEESVIAFGNPYAYYVGGIRMGMGSGVAGGDMVFQTCGVCERMRILSGGDIGIGTSTISSKLTIYEGDIRLYKKHVINCTGTWASNIFFTDEVDRKGAAIVGERTAWDGAPMALGFETGGVGTITRRMTITSAGIACFGYTVCAPCFATISDYRMKSNIRPIEGLSIIMNTKPYKFEYNYDCSTSFGMIAHELQDTVPEAVFGYKDGEVMQGVDYMKLLPIAIKAIQELKAENDIFKTCLGIS